MLRNGRTGHHCSPSAQRQSAPHLSALDRRGRAFLSGGSLATATGVSLSGLRISSANLRRGASSQALAKAIANKQAGKDKESSARRLVTLPEMANVPKQE
jgi:hypothetical protein